MGKVNVVVCKRTQNTTLLKSDSALAEKQHVVDVLASFPLKHQNHR